MLLAQKKMFLWGLWDGLRFAILMLNLSYGTWVDVNLSWPYKIMCGLKYILAILKCHVEKNIYSRGYRAGIA